MKDKRQPMDDLHTPLNRASLVDPRSSFIVSLWPSARLSRYPALLVIVILAAAAWTAAGPAPATCRLDITLTDKATRALVAGVVQVRDASGAKVQLAGLVPRGTGLAAASAANDWFVVDGAASVDVPAARLTLSAISGLETEMTTVELDLAMRDRAEVRVPLNRFWNAAARGYRSGNTHLHMRQISRQNAEQYLRQVPLADALDVVFISYLERVEADLEYTTNKYTAADVRRLSTSSVAFGYGEEHRHNSPLARPDSGYGHVMLFNIPELVQPVSLGLELTGREGDGVPLRSGIEHARRMGATVVWCHDRRGTEDIPNWIMGRIDANNIFDGGKHGSYKHSLYRYLNAGFRVPFSTGTDWYIYDFSRAYVQMDGQVTPERWLGALVAGRSWITNGPLFEFEVDGRAIGDTIDLERPRNVSVAGRVLGRLDFGRAEVIRNGEVVQQVASRRDGDHYVADVRLDLWIDEPSWLALRTPPPSVPEEAEFQVSTPRNEYGAELFGHTSPVYVTLGGHERFDTAAAQDLVDEMRRSLDRIGRTGVFHNAASRALVMSVYNEAIERMNARIAAEGSSTGGAEQR